MLIYYLDSNEFISEETLYRRTLVEYFKCLDKENNKNYENCEILKRLRTQRSFTHEDEIEIVQNQKDSETERKLLQFYEEHLHEDDEIRLILDGIGYFDVRDLTGRWIRTELIAGDLIILPAGIYHRFSIESNFLKAKRFFSGQPDWTPYSKQEGDQMDIRKVYRTKLDDIQTQF